jgi:hypothetical protein
MMETAQARARNHRRLGRRLLLNWPAIRSVLVEGVVNPIFAIIADVISDQPPKMLFVERNHVVEYLSATRFHPAFGDTVLPGSLNARLLWLQTRDFQEGDDFRVDLRVAVQDDVTIRTSFGEGLTQLLDDHSAVGCRVTLKCKILQRPCSITKKQYSSLNVTVGTVKKSKAAITSR